MRAVISKRSAAAAIVCALIALLAILYYPMYYGSRLMIINNSNDPITNVVVEAGGSRITFDRIARGGKRSSSIHIGGDSSVVISYIDKNGNRREFGDGYVTQSMDVLITIEVQSASSFRISMDSLEDWWESLPHGRLNRRVNPRMHIQPDTNAFQRDVHPEGSP